MKILLLFLLCVTAYALSACGGSVAPVAGGRAEATLRASKLQAYDLDLQQTEVAGNAQNAAQQAQVEAQQTANALTQKALDVAAAKVTQAAEARADALRATDTANNKTATALEKVAQATTVARQSTEMAQRVLWTEESKQASTAQAQVFAITAAAATSTAKADAASASATEVFAKQTAEAGALAAQKDAASATATLQAIGLIIHTDELNAAREERAAEEREKYVPATIIAVTVFGVLVVLVFALVKVSEMLNSRAEEARHKRAIANANLLIASLKRTHDGRYLGLAPGVDGQLAYKQIEAGEVKTIIQPDEDEVSDVPMVDVIPFHTQAGETLDLEKEPTEQRLAEMKRQALVIKFLNKVERHYRRLGMNVETTDTIPPATQMGLAAETWTTAVQLLKPYVETKEGKGGSTRTVGQFATVGALLGAVRAEPMKVVLGMVVKRKLTSPKPLPHPTPTEVETPEVVMQNVPA